MTPVRLHAAFIPVALWALATGASSVAAQAIPELRDPPAASEFSPGQLVRLTAPGLVIESGLIEAIEGDAIVVSASGQEWSVDTQTLEEVFVQERLVGRYTLVGFFPGLAAGAIAEVFIHKFQCDEPCTESSAYGRSALIGGLAGAGMGAIIGATTTRWRQLFP